MNITYDNNETVQNELQQLRDFEQELKQKKKKLDEKVKFQKALRGLKDPSQSGQGKVQGSAKAGSVASSSSSQMSFMYAMVLALVMQMNTNLKSMGAQAEHVQFLDKQTDAINGELANLQEEASKVTNYTDPDSLLASSDISSKMDILGNQFTANQQKQTQDTAILQGIQTNNGSESGEGQAFLDADKQMFRLIHFRKG